MNRIEKVTLSLIITLFLLGMMTGCGKSEKSGKKYIGEYVGQFAVCVWEGESNFLEIKEDGTWVWKTVFPQRRRADFTRCGLQAPDPIIQNGEWEIWEGKILLYQGRSRNVLIEGELEDNEFVDRRSGKVFVKQDTHVDKKSVSQKTDIEKTERVSRKTAKAREKLAKMDIYSEAAFLRCVEKGDITTVNLFLAAGMNPSAKDNDGESALALAVHGGYTEIIQALLAKGADVNAKSVGGWTALATAANEGYTKIVQILLANGADANMKDNGWETSLMRAAGCGYTEIVQALLAKGADVNAKSVGGWTSLIRAARGGHTEIVQALLAKGADVNAKKKYGNTALMYAAERGSTDIIQALLANGTNANAKNLEGETALMFAVKLGHTETVQALLAYGADVNAKDNYYGRTALTLASMKNHTQIANLLKNAGAKE